MRILACSSPYGKGGVGQHFAQLVEETRRENALAYYVAPEVKAGDARGRVLASRLFPWLHRYTPVRFSPGWSSHLGNELFDRKMAAQLEELEEPVERFMGFVGKSLRSFRRARALGFDQLELVAANSHVNNLKRLHERAARQTGIKDTWLNEAQRRKTLGEYEQADIIYVHSEYVRQSFIEEGVAPEKLRRMHLAVDERFQPPAARPDDEVFRVVYVGRVEATKGIPLLLEAFSRLSAPRAELHIVGGWSTRTMRRYMQRWMARDARIQVAPGDPLPVLQEADVFVHPTFEDGFGYAPMEALACGVPVIVTEDTGMKEYVRDGENGYIVPTGSWQALLERMEHLRRHPLPGRASLDPLTVS